MIHRRSLSAAIGLGSLLAVAATALPAQPATAGQASPEIYLQHVKTLADPAMQGRGAGSEGLVKARDYIVEQFERLGLEPASGTGSYLQPFSVTTGAELGPDNHLVLEREGQQTSLELREDYAPLSFSSSGDVTAPLVFAGYGASADEFDYDDYFHLPVEGKIVIILRREPPKFNPKDGPPTHHSHLISKAINAKNHGAKAVILVNGKLEENAEDLLIKFGTESGPDNAGVPMVHAKNAVVDGWLRAAGKSLTEIQEAIDKDSKPQSFLLPESVKVTLAVDIERKHATVANVLGYLPGEIDEYVILGAHYDHLGHGDRSSLAPSQVGKVHPGADDNASGTAGLLELARILSENEAPRRRGVLFMAFAAEEIGLLGARQWVENPTRPIGGAVAMINMDMIGRIRDRKVYLGGAGTGSSFEASIDDVQEDHELKLEIAKSGYSASDHTMFVTKKIPVLFFFSGLHSDYHKPSDTWDKIDAGTAAELVDLVADLSGRIAAEDRPEFVRVEPERRPGMPGGGGGGYGAYFGSVPDFGQIDKGVKFADIRPGSPADKAGLKGGDILIQFDEKPINNLYDFTYALRASKIGQTVTVKYLRDGEERTAKVTLEQRK